MQFNHVLFATDFSDSSLALTGEVEWLANRFRASVTFLHVLEVPAIFYGGFDCGIAVMNSIEDLAAETRERLETFRIAIPADRLRRVLRKGDVAKEIEDYVNENGVDLIVMGTHGHGPIRNLLCGSALAKVLHDTDRPVWTAAYSNGVCRYWPVISKVLCAVEFTGEAVPLIQSVEALAASFSAQVRLVHAVPGAETRPNKYFDFDLQRFLMDDARIEIAKVQRAAGTNFPVSIGSGSISHAVADAAAEYGADLVVIGRGKSQTVLGPLRTHAYDIIRQVPCPVLSVVIPQDRISSFCTEAHRGQFAEDEQLQTDSLTTSAMHQQ